MFRNLERYIEFFYKSGIKTKVVNNILWREYQRMAVPIGPVKFNYRISKEEAKFLLSEFPKAIMVRLTYDFDIPKNTGWYAVICDKLIDLSELPSNNRSQIRRGLRNCTVEKVDANFISKYGYDVYVAAFKRYKGVNPIDEKNFIRNILITKEFVDIVHYWGVFEKDAGRLIAYAQNYIYDKIEVNYSTIKFHPDYLKHYSSYALIFSMNRYYLNEQQFEYTNDGFRSILHQTNVQDYLTQKFNFRRANAKLKIIYRSYLPIFLSISHPFKNILGKLHPKIKALYEIEEIRRQC